MFKNKINWLKRRNFTNSLNNARSSKQKWNFFKPIGANKEINKLDDCSHFNVNDLNEFYASIHSSSYEDTSNILSNTIHEHLQFNFHTVNAVDISNAIKNISSNAIGTRQ